MTKQSIHSREELRRLRCIIRFTYISLLDLSSNRKGRKLFPSTTPSPPDPAFCILWPLPLGAGAKHYYMWFWSGVKFGSPQAIGLLEFCLCFIITQLHPPMHQPYRHCTHAKWVGESWKKSPITWHIWVEWLRSDPYAFISQKPSKAKLKFFDF